MTKIGQVLELHKFVLDVAWRASLKDIVVTARLAALVRADNADWHTLKSAEI